MRSVSEILSTPIEQLTKEEKELRDYCMEPTDLMSRPQESLTPDEKAACEYWGAQATQPIPVPVLSGDYVHIYQIDGQEMYFYGEEAEE